MIDALSLAISNGNYAVTACQLCDISNNQFYLWHQQAETDIQQGLTEEDSIYIKLYYSVKRAEAAAEDALVEVVREAGTVKREWLPAMTFLERRHPDRWGRRDRRDININETKTINITRVEIAMPRGELIEGEARELPEGKDDDSP